MTDTVSVEEGTQWWRELTERGSEGMVVKPLEFVVRGRRGMTQPAVKCRGPEYLRIIYGPEYLLAENLERLRSRSVSTKRWSDSFAKNHFVVSTSAFSVSSPSKASPLILVSDELVWGQWGVGRAVVSVQRWRISARNCCLFLRMSWTSA